MRNIIVVSVISASILACSSSSSGGDGGLFGNSSSSSSSSGGSSGGSGSSSGGTVTGSCTIPTANYSIHWTAAASNNTICSALAPSDTTAMLNGQPPAVMGMNGTNCTQSQNNCNFSISCTDNQPDAGVSSTATEMISINSDQSLSGSLDVTFSIMAQGVSESADCKFTFTGTKQ